MQNKDTKKRLVPTRELFFQKPQTQVNVTTVPQTKSTPPKAKD